MTQRINVKVTDCSRTDLTEYSERELSLHVMNDEYLYRNRYRQGFKSLLDELFIYTPEQWEELQEDLLEEDGHLISEES